MMGFLKIIYIYIFINLTSRLLRTLNCTFSHTFILSYSNQPDPIFASEIQCLQVCVGLFFFMHSCIIRQFEHVLCLETQSWHGMSTWEDFFASTEITISMVLVLHLTAKLQGHLQKML